MSGRVWFATHETVEPCREAVVRKEDNVESMQGVDFGAALNGLRAGGRASRAGWNGKGMWIALQTPDAHSKMGLPYLYMRTVGGQLVPWLASQTDILAADWNVEPAAP